MCPRAGSETKADGIRNKLEKRSLYQTFVKTLLAER